MAIKASDFKANVLPTGCAARVRTWRPEPTAMSVLSFVAALRTVFDPRKPFSLAAAGEESPVMGCASFCGLPPLLGLALAVGAVFCFLSAFSLVAFEVRLMPEVPLDALLLPVNAKALGLQDPYAMLSACMYVRVTLSVHTSRCGDVLQWWCAWNWGSTWGAIQPCRSLLPAQVLQAWAVRQQK